MRICGPAAVFNLWLPPVSMVVRLSRGCFAALFPVAEACVRRLDC